MENKHQPLSHPKVYYKRLFNQFIIAFLILFIALIIGVMGYHFIARLSWIDSIYNASMILGGMGPVNEISNAYGKLFASVYAIFCGILLIATFGLVFTPVLHRVMHTLHLENK